MIVGTVTYPPVCSLRHRVTKASATLHFMSRLHKRRKKLPAEAVTLEISGLSHEGRGIAHIDGKVAFVDGALPGETVSAKYVRNRSQFSELKVEEILTPAAQRVSPPCQYTSICGGCSLQHWDCDGQLEFKQSVLLEHLLALLL